MFRFAAYLAILAALAGDALAGPTLFNALDSDDQAWFYNRPGITLTELASDTVACQQYARAAVNSGGGNTQYGLTGEVLFAINSGGPTAWHHDNCMIARGYRRFTAPDRNLRTFAARFESMSEEQRLALVAAEAPAEGILARQWENAYWRDAEPGDGTRRIEMRAGARVANRLELLEPVDLRSPITLGPDQVLLVFSLQFGASAQDRFRNGAVQFTHDNRATGMPELAPFGRNGSMRWPWVAVELRARDVPADSSPMQFAFVAPAGFYSLSGMYAFGVRRDKAALSSGCKPRPADAPAGSDRSRQGGNELAEAFDNRVTNR